MSTSVCAHTVHCYCSLASHRKHTHTHTNTFHYWCESDLSDHSWIQRVSNKKLSYDGDTSKDIRESKNIGIWDCCVNILNRNINQRFLIKNAESENVCTKMKFFDLNASNHGESLIFNQHCIRMVYDFGRWLFTQFVIIATADMSIFIALIITSLKLKTKNWFD